LTYSALLVICARDNTKSTTAAAAAVVVVVVVVVVGNLKTLPVRRFLSKMYECSFKTSSRTRVHA